MTSIRTRVGNALLPVARAYIRYSPFVIGEKTLRRYFAWREREFECRTRYGFMMHCDNHDVVQQHIYWHGDWEPTLSRWLWSQLRRGDLFVDVGANVGYFTLLASHRVGRTGRVITVEPSPRTLAALHRQLALNGVSNVTVHAVAIGAAEGEAVLFSGEHGNSGQASLLPTWVGGTAEATVGVTTVDALLQPADRAALRVLKMDVEGFEAEAIAGARETIRDAREAAFIIETNPANYPAIRHAFQHEGYACYSMTTEVIGVPNPERPVRRELDTIPHQMDLVFSREQADAL